MESDPVRKLLKPYLADLEILHDDPGGCTVAPWNIEYCDSRWHEINDAIKQLDGSWIKATRFSKGHWRIPRLQNRAKIGSK